jgi:thioredoxin 1
MSVRYINDADFQREVLESDVPVIVDFTAAWCGPCKAIAPLLDQAEGDYAGRVKIVKIDIDANPGTPTSFKVMNIPTLRAFKGGQVVQRQVGALNKAALDQWIARAL